MKQVRIRSLQHTARVWLDPLPLGARDPDIVRAKQLASRVGRTRPRLRRTPA
jgi:hypothetical protein